MRVATELINKSVFSIEEGKELGKVKDFFLDQDVKHLTAVSLGSDGLFGRDEKVIKWSDVVTLGEDAVLVKDARCIRATADVADLQTFVRRSEIRGRRIDTPGGTMIGHIGDLILDEEAHIVGFSLPQTYVSGPVADNQAISRSAVVDTGHGENAMTAILAEAEKADLQVVYEGLFAEPAVSPPETE